jgi:polysaccharide export outer membrane protein
MNLLNTFLMVAGLVLAGEYGQETAKQAAPDSSTKKNDVKEATPPISRTSVNDAEYKIGPQDLLRIDVWKEPEITRTVPVRPDGKISLPLLNDVQAAGLTPMELSAVIGDGLKKYITNPQVTVTVSEINSRRVYVSGEVVRAGAFPLLPNMTVLQALSSSGGFSQFAKLKGIYVLRVEEGKQVKHPFNYKDVVSGKAPEQNILLQPGDVIVVP